MLSIITPVYNGRTFIDACIQVVIEQDCAEVEHIIVDGLSTDGTLNIIQQYAEKYSHIRWVSEKDMGQSDAMNKGLCLAQGDVIGILNVDDFYQPGVLNRVAGLFKTLPVPTLLVGNCNVLDASDKVMYVNKPKRLRFTDLLLGTTVFEMPLNPSAYFYHQALHQKIGFYKVDEHYLMDLDFLLRAVRVAHVKYIDETWGNLRVIEGTKTVIDVQSGQHQQRIQTLLESYWNTLPVFQRWPIKLSYAFFSSRVVSPLVYFWKRPQELSWRLKARLAKVFGRGPK